MDLASVQQDFSDNLRFIFSVLKTAQNKFSQSKVFMKEVQSLSIEQDSIQISVALLLSLL